MSDASASVAIASISAGNTQIVLFAMFIIFVLMLIWFCNTFVAVAGNTSSSSWSTWSAWSYWSIPLSDIKIKPISLDKTTPLDIPTVDIKLPTPEKSVEPDSLNDEIQAVKVDVQNVKDIVEKRAAFKDSLEYHGVTKSMEVQNEMDKRLYAALERIDALEAAEKKRSEAETKKKEDDAHKKAVADEITSIDNQIAHRDGVEFDLILEEKPMIEIIQHLRERFPNLVSSGTLNNEGDIVCWVFKIPGSIVAVENKSGK